VCSHLKEEKLKTKFFLAAFLFAGISASNAFADLYDITMYVDDFGSLSIGGILVGSYDGVPAASITNTIDLAPGWHSIEIDYKNRFGTNSLALQWTLPGDSLSIIPLANLRSLDQNGDLVSGLRGDYFSLAGTPLFTVYGEGPIHHSALNFADEIYEGQPGLWAGTFGPSATFQERLSGEIFLPPSEVPEPSAIVLLGSVGALLFWKIRRAAAKGRF
jgi:hypothetical protein